MLSCEYHAQTEKVDIMECLGRILAEDVTSDINMPPFDKSAMDGYAARRCDLGKPLEVIETIKAGDIPQKKIHTCQCSKIMTGSIIPEGADCVIMVEETEQHTANTILFTGRYRKSNIALKAEDIAVGTVVLKKSTLIRPQEVAVLATVGCVQPLVFKMPRIIILSTGDEIVEPHIKPSNGKIRNSNAYQLHAQILKMHFKSSYGGIICDTPQKLEETLAHALSNHDLIILTGGISMGDYDYVPDILKKLGVDLCVQKIDIKPGKPTIFGQKHNTFVFGLPGNPVSSFVIFELFTKPFIYKMAGHTYEPRVLSLPMADDYTVKGINRLSWQPIVITPQKTVEAVRYHGSGHIHALSKADGIMRVEAGKAKILKGEQVHVRQI